jgi:hypothetical protein
MSADLWNSLLNLGDLICVALSLVLLAIGLALFPWKGRKPW